MISYILSFGLLLLIGYAWIQSRTSKFISASLTLLCCVGIVLVWFPDLAQTIAHSVGVGRGVDLVIYLWIFSSLFLSFNLHFQLRRERENFTRLVRSLAIERATQQSSGNAERP